MRRSLIAALSATVTALGISGCAGGDRSQRSAPPAPGAPTVAAPPAGTGPLPPPEALADVMYRLADTGVPGVEKLVLVHNTAPAEAATLDAFGMALRDGGFTPITVTASDIRWFDTHPGHILATVTITTANPDDPGEFAFPMEFRPGAGGWQLARETADMLLAFGSVRTEAHTEARIEPAVPGPPPPSASAGTPPQPVPTPGR